ncbi:enoyl-CoA hydratase-related protein [Dyella sp. GSA-30]|uniref:enoyl-CoA hydratase-related protein n=1 Tax=Dyella sp. GSA-30 TaxID=2994496 RepID=UPI00248FEDE4|nr:enoyl-CoA hydratase-related protein [Dyella sp. GSA-30]BDU20807.1 enoyl-CoA hydratase [Dyella sp. GSA-30]
MRYETIETEVNAGVATIVLNRPRRLNALNTQLMKDLLAAATAFDADPRIGCLIITGNERIFSAGADIGELADQSYISMQAADFFGDWDRFAALRLPKVAAVSGDALGGGCELAMMCDLILAADTARFGQPEVKIGCIPGIGGSQRLTRLVGRAQAMDMILTGRLIDAQEALRIGLVSRVMPAGDLAKAAQAVAHQVAGYPRDIVQMARTSVNMAEQVGLEPGMRFERQMYYALYGHPAQREGMSAFLEKREPRFGNAPSDAASILAA